MNPPHVRSGTPLVQGLRLASALAVVLSLTCLFAGQSAQAQGGRWLWYANASGWHHAFVVRLAAGPHVAVYAKPGGVTAHDARVIADAFSWRIYPTDTGTFGSPSGLGSVSIALLPLGGYTLGYFNEDDILPNRIGADSLHSNRGNFLYVRTPQSMPDSDKLTDVGEVVAHELQHLIDFRVRVVDHRWSPEDDWLNEGLAVYAQFANHYFTPRDGLKLQAAAADPGWRLTALNSANASFVAHARTAYGRAGLFVSYLASRFGPSIARDVVDTEQPGMPGVAAVLHRRHASLQRVFSDWGVASWVDQHGRFGYSNLPRDACSQPRTLAPLVPMQDVEFGYTRRLVMAAWSQQYLTLGSGQPGTLVVHVSGNTTHLRAALVLQRPGDTRVTSVHWLAADESGRLTTRLMNYGELYTRATVVLNQGFSTTDRNRLRVTAHVTGLDGEGDSPHPSQPPRGPGGSPVGHSAHTR